MEEEDENSQNGLRYPVEHLNSLTAGPALPYHRIQLKKGFKVMLLRNLCPQEGHVNGARHTVEHMSNNLLHLKVAVGSHAGKRLTLPRVPCGPEDDNFPIPGFKRTQFPVLFCFGMTINKAQGQSFCGKRGLDLSEDCFAHGQLYVGESRVTDPRNLTVCTTRADNRTRNVVYREALSAISELYIKNFFYFFFLSNFPRLRREGTYMSLKVSELRQSQKFISTHYIFYCFKI